jgi:5-methylcytosine-specific restriction protein A
MRHNILRRDNYVCQVCEEPYPEYKLEVDHIIPLSQGGYDVESNCQLLCISCHQQKTNSERHSR